MQDDSIIPGLGACLKSPVEDVIKGANDETDDTFCVDTASSLEFGSLGALGAVSIRMSISMVFHIIMPGRAADPTAGASARVQTPSGSEARCFMHPVMMDHGYGIMID